MKKNIVFTTLALIIALSLSARASALKPEHVAKDAKWVLHFDNDTFKASQFGVFLQDNNNLPEKTMKRQLEKMAEQFGFDPWQDFAALVIYGTDLLSPFQTVSLFYGNFDNALIEKTLQEKEDLQKVEYAGHKLFGIKAGMRNRARRGHEKAPSKRLEPRRNWVSLHSKNIIVFGRSEESVKKAMDVIDGREVSILRDDHLIVGARATEGSFLFVRADLADGNAMVRSNPVLNTVDFVDIVIAEQNGAMNGNFVFKAEDADKAAAIAVGIEGMIAFGTLSATQNPVLSLIAESSKVSVADDMVVVAFSTEIADLSKLVLDAITARMGRGF
ncbi:MAG: hypothetical protein GX811_05395 [Lentisphaerae bacterium]|jgi:hypothetical protein|nr:hypothetical protein [Lentisphaerota bacterium]